MEDFVSLEEEALLLDAIDWTSANDDVTGEALLNVFLPVCAWFLSSGHVEHLTRFTQIRLCHSAF